MSQRREEDADTDSFAMIGGDNPWDQAQAKVYTRQRSSTGPVITLVVLALIAVALAVAVWSWLAGGSQQNRESLAAAPETSTTTSTHPSTTTKKSSTTSSSSTSSRPRSSTSTKSSSKRSSTSLEPTSSSPLPPPIALGQAGQSQCGDMGGHQIWSGNGNTSCEFAREVGYALAGTPDGQNATIKATSPVTGQRYTMDCRSLGNGYFDCHGGDSAQVIISGR